jgi:hypothetical protein
LAHCIVPRVDGYYLSDLGATRTTAVQEDNALQICRQFEARTLLDQVGQDFIKEEDGLRGA